MRRGWTILLCAYLLVWVPITVAQEMFTTIPSLEMRGAPAVLELTTHAAVAMLCAVAGRMLLVGVPAAQPVAAAAVIAAGLLAVQSLFWTALPRQTAPGQRLPLALLWLLHAIFWLAMIRTGRAGPSESSA